MTDPTNPTAPDHVHWWPNELTPCECGAMWLDDEQPHGDPVELLAQVDAAQRRWYTARAQLDAAFGAARLAAHDEATAAIELRALIAQYETTARDTPL